MVELNGDWIEIANLCVRRFMCSSVLQPSLNESYVRPQVLGGLRQLVFFDKFEQFSR